MSKINTTFAVKLPNGRFEVGDLTRPDLGTREATMPPEGAKVLNVDATQWETMRVNPDALRKAVLGETSPVNKLASLVQHPLDKATHRMQALAQQIETFVQGGGKGGFEGINKAAKKLGDTLEKEGTARAFLKDPARQGEVRDEVSRLRDAVRKLNGMEATDGTVREFIEGLGSMNRFLTATGGGAGVTGDATVTKSGTWTFFGRDTGLQVNVRRWEFD